MKRLFTSLLCTAFVGSGLMAQSIALDAHDTDVYGFADASLIAAKFDVSNTTGSDIQVLVNAYQEEQLDGTTNYFCWKLCYPDRIRIAPENDFVVIPANSSVSNFFGDFLPLDNEGTSTVRYKFFVKDQEKFDFQETTITYHSITPKMVGSSTFCAGESTNIGPMLDVYESYLWSTGETTRNINVSTMGTYTVTVTLGDEERVLEQMVQESTDLTLQLNGDLEFCEGDQGFATAGTGFDTYLWSTGSTTEGTGFMTSGTHTVTVTSGACTGTASVDVTMHPNPSTPSITDELQWLDNQETVVLSASAAESYRWWDENDEMMWDEWEQELIPEENITVSVQVVNEYGCTSERSEEYTTTNVGVEELALQNQISVFPNPANEMIVVELAGATYTSGKITLRNTLGQVVAENGVQQMQRNVISTVELEAGIYLMSVTLDNEVVSAHQVVVNH